MFSYSNPLKEMVPDIIYARGQKIFLDGKVIAHTEMVLDYWREYRVKATNRSDEYYIRIPVIHLALDRKKWDRVHEVYDDLVTCDCPYTTQYGGLCKHIVAVSLSLDNEFGFTKANSKARNNSSNATNAKTQIDNLLDQIMEAEDNKLENAWLQDFENLLENPNWGSKHVLLSNITRENTKLSNNSEKVYLEFWDNLELMIDSQIKDFDKEKKVLQVAVETLVYDAEFWWKFWVKFIPKIDFQNAKMFWARVYRWRGDYKINSFYPQLVTFATKNYSDIQKAEILEIIIREQKINFKEQLEFCLDFNYITWIQEHLHLVDPANLLKIVKILPDEAERIELSISNQLIEWGEFIQPEGYDDLVLVFREWKKQLGLSDLLVETAKGIIQLNKRRIKLVTSLKAVCKL